jgi:hypothetical protein
MEHSEDQGTGTKRGLGAVDGEDRGRWNQGATAIYFRGPSTEVWGSQRVTHRKVAPLVHELCLANVGCRCLKAPLVSMDLGHNSSPN